MQGTRGNRVATLQAGSRWTTRSRAARAGRARAPRLSTSEQNLPPRFPFRKEVKTFFEEKKETVKVMERLRTLKKIIILFFLISSRQLRKNFFRPKSCFGHSFPKRSFCNCSLNCCCCSNAYKVFQLIVVDKFLSTLTISLLILFKACTLTKQQSKILKRVCKKAPREKT